MPKKKRNLGGFLKDVGFDILGTLFDKDPTGLTRVIAKRIPGLQDAINDDTLTDKQAWEQAMNANPTLAKELRAIEVQETQMQLKALVDLENADVERDRVHAQDRQSARAMAVQSGNNHHFYIALGVLLFCAFMIVSLLFVEVPEGNQRLLDISFGTIIGGSFVSVISFYFGSSSGSKSKTDSLDRILNGNKSHKFEPFDRLSK